MTMSTAPSASNPSDPTLDPFGKGLGAAADTCTLSQVPSLRWNILDEDVSLPVAVLYEDRIAHNLSWMQRFMQAYGVALAPHGKTTMAPALFKRQLDSGAWGITLATAPQIRAAYRHGVRRVIMANQLVGRANMAIIAELLRDSSFSFYGVVDSADNVAQLGAFFAEQGLVLPVMIELGVAGGRNGVRDDTQLEAVLAEVARWPQSIALAGIELYEGVLAEESAIRAFLTRAVDTLKSLASRGVLSDHVPTILTGAGSAWFDVVADVFSQADIGRPLQIVLRPGCYLTHDVGIYRGAAERINADNAVARSLTPGLLPAMQVWAYVQSLPEPGRAIIAMGKRDAAFDAGLPVPAKHYRPVGMSGLSGSTSSAGASSNPGGSTTRNTNDGASPQSTRPEPTPADPAWTITAMMDQHAFMSIPPDADLRVGDMIAFDISHPCLTFDKWRQVLLVDAQYDVTEVAQTFF